LKDFAEEVKINRFKLEEECERHVSLYHYYSSERAKTRADLDDTNDKLKLTLAEAEEHIRNNWENDYAARFGKMTEAGVKAATESDKNIVYAKEKVREINRNLYILEAATYSLDHRKSMLDNLVTLLVKGFYAAPNGGRREGPAEQATEDNRKALKNKVSKKK